MASGRLDKTLVTLTAPSSFAAEQYQGLRLKCEQLRRARDVRVIAITSPGAGEGKTLTSINLAGALARGADARVLLIDADLRRPTIAASLGIADRSRGGLSDLVSGDTAKLPDVAQRLDRFDFDVVPVGGARMPAHQVLRSPKLDAVLREARGQYDFVLLDTPPLLPVFDSALLARAVDGVLVVVAANRTPRKLLEEALNLLDPAKVLGIVFNRDARPLFGYYRSYYGSYFENENVA